MSCFWDTLLSKIKKEDIQTILSLHNPTPKDFANTLKTKNIPTDNVLWMGAEITQQMKEENMMVMKEDWMLIMLKSLVSLSLWKLVNLWG